MKVGFALRGVPSYRFPLYRKLWERKKLDFQVFCHHFDGDATQVGFSQPKEMGSVPMQRFPAGIWTQKVMHRFGYALPSRELVQSVRDYSPDVLVLEGLSNIGNARALWPWLKKSNIPFIWWGLGNIPSQRSSLKADIGRLLQQKFLHQAAAVLSYSSYGAKVYRDLGVPEEKIFIAYNTLDEQDALAKMDPRAPVPPELRDFSSSQTEVVFVFCGTINTGKKLDLLMETFAKVAKEHPCKLLVIGDGPEKTRNELLAKKLGLNQQVLFVGRRDRDVANFLAAADVMVLPGLGGLAINHAFIHRLPIICGPADGCEQDLVETGKTGWLLPEVTIASLQAAMTDAVLRCSELEAMGGRGYVKVTEQITMNRYAAVIEDAVAFAASNAVQ